MSKRGRAEEEEEEEVEEIEEVEDGEEPEAVVEPEKCPCKMCVDGVEGVLKRMEQLTEANARVVNQLAKEVFDNKNAMMSLLSKLMTTVEEIQANHVKLGQRTEKIATVVRKKIKTGGEESANQDSLDNVRLLSLEQKLATLQDLIVKGFAKLK